MIHLHSSSVGCVHGELCLLASLQALKALTILFSSLLLPRQNQKQAKTKTNKQITICFFLHYPNLLSWTFVHYTKHNMVHLSQSYPGQVEWKNYFACSVHDISLHVNLFHINFFWLPHDIRYCRIGLHKCRTSTTP